MQGFHCPFMLMSLCLIVNHHAFQPANEHQAIGVRSALGDTVTNQHQEMCVKPVSGQLRTKQHGEETR